MMRKQTFVDTKSRYHISYPLEHLDELFEVFAKLACELVAQGVS